MTMLFSDPWKESTVPTRTCCSSGEAANMLRSSATCPEYIHMIDMSVAVYTLVLDNMPCAIALHT